MSLRKELRPSKTFLRKAERVHWERYNYLCDLYDNEDEAIEQILYLVLKKYQKIKLRIIKQDTISKMRKVKENRLTNSEIEHLRYYGNRRSIQSLINERVSHSPEIKAIIQNHKQKVKRFETISENIIYTLTDNRYWKNRKDKIIETTKKYKEELISRAWHPSRLDWVLDNEERDEIEDNFN